MNLYKVTDEHGRAMYGGTGQWRKNRWRSVKGELVPCWNGLHLCREQDLVNWLGPVIWRAEYDGELIEAEGKVVARRARVTERLTTWNERTARLFAADCAEHVLPIFEKKHPGDSRARDAIAVARRFANGEATSDELAAARAAARDAVRAAARDAARAAGRDAGWAAARDAAWAAARAAGRDAGWATAWAAAWDAAWDAAAGDAAWDAAAGDAAWAAARDAAWDAAWAWQTGRLMWYLEGGAE